MRRGDTIQQCDQGVCESRQAAHGRQASADNVLRCLLGANGECALLAVEGIHAGGDTGGLGLLWSDGPGVGADITRGQVLEGNQGGTAGAQEARGLEFELGFQYNLHCTVCATCSRVA